jgi:uncharacterized membrane protein
MIYLVFLVISVLLLNPVAAPISVALFWIVVKVLPLLLFAPAIWLKKSYGLLALTLVILVYMGFATMHCFAKDLEQALAFVELVLATWLILACSKTVKSLPRGHGAL